MKTLYGLVASTLLFGLVLAVTLARSPGADIVGISDGDSHDGSEMIVLYKGGTFDQFLIDQKSLKVGVNHGTWNNTTNDPASEIYHAYMGTEDKTRPFVPRHPVRPQT